MKFYLKNFYSDKLKMQRSRLIYPLLKNTEPPVVKPRPHITTAKEVREQLSKIRDKLESNDKDFAELPNIGLSLVKTTFKVPLIQEYYGQLVEDIQNRLFSNYEADEYNGSLFLIRNATPANIKVALVMIFNKLTKKNKNVWTNIEEIQYRFPAFSILENKEWLQEKLFFMLHPESTPDTFYSDFLQDLGTRMTVQLLKQNEIRSISPALFKLNEHIKKIPSDGTQRKLYRKAIILAKLYINTIANKKQKSCSSDEGSDSEPKLGAFKSLIKSYFGEDEDYMHYSQLSDDGFNQIMEMAKCEKSNDLFDESLTFK
jgi:hypothetical protein